MSKKAKTKAPEPVDGFAEHNAHCVTAIDTIAWSMRNYLNPGEPITEGVMRLIAEVAQFRAEEMHSTYRDAVKRRKEVEKGGKP